MISLKSATHEVGDISLAPVASASHLFGLGKRNLFMFIATEKDSFYLENAQMGPARQLTRDESFGFKAEVVLDELFSKRDPIDLHRILVRKSAFPGYPKKEHPTFFGKPAVYTPLRTSGDAKATRFAFFTDGSGVAWRPSLDMQDHFEILPVAVMLTGQMKLPYGSTPRVEVKPMPSKKGLSLLLVKRGYKTVNASFYTKAGFVRKDYQRIGTHRDTHIVTSEEFTANVIAERTRATEVAEIKSESQMAANLKRGWHPDDVEDQDDIIRSCGRLAEELDKFDAHFMRAPHPILRPEPGMANGASVPREVAERFGHPEVAGTPFVTPPSLSGSCISAERLERASERLHAAMMLFLAIVPEASKGELRINMKSPHNLAAHFETNLTYLTTGRWPYTSAGIFKKMDPASVLRGFEAEFTGIDVEEAYTFQYVPGKVGKHTAAKRYPFPLTSGLHHRPSSHDILAASRLIGPEWAERIMAVKPE